MIPGVVIKVLIVIAALGPAWGFILHFIFANKDTRAHRNLYHNMSAVFGFLGGIATFLDIILAGSTIGGSTAVLGVWQFMFYGPGAWFWVVTLIYSIIYLNYKDRKNDYPEAFEMFYVFLGVLMAIGGLIFIVWIAGKIWMLSSGLVS